MRNHSTRLLDVFIMASFAIIAWFTFPFVPVQAAPNAQPAFQALYDREDMANANKDANALLSSFSPDYVAFDARGEEHHYDQVRDGMLKLFAKYKSIRVKTVVQSVKLAQNSATVVARAHNILVHDGDSPGQEVKVTSDETDRDFWIRTPSGWKLKQERVLSLHSTRDVMATQ